MFWINAFLPDDMDNQFLSFCGCGINLKLLSCSSFWSLCQTFVNTALVPIEPPRPSNPQQIGMTHELEWTCEIWMYHPGLSCGLFREHLSSLGKNSVCSKKVDICRAFRVREGFWLMSNENIYISSTEGPSGPQVHLLHPALNPGKLPIDYTAELPWALFSYWKWPFVSTGTIFGEHIRRKWRCLSLLWGGWTVGFQHW